MYRPKPNDPLEGAFEGIMGIVDNPNKNGQRFYCSKKVETPGGFKHREQVYDNYVNLDDYSLKESVYLDSQIPSKQDSVRNMAVQDTNELVLDLQAAANFESRSECDSNLAQSIEVDYGSSYEVLDNSSTFSE